MHAYSVYGLGVHSEFAIPELLECESARPDIVVSRASLEGFVGAARLSATGSGAGEESDDSWAERFAEQDETLCVFAGVGRYLVRAGRAVVVDTDGAGDFAAVRHLLLGPVLAHLLWQRGIFALHASVVEVGERRLGFVGVSGEGKSTIAAALEAAGHTLVCDDVAALVDVGERVHVLPGFPRIRLHADSLLGLGDDPAGLPLVHEQLSKRLRRVSRFASSSAALDALYVLGSGAELAAPRLAPGAAIMEIARHTYYAHQFAPLYGFQHHLERARSIAERVPTFRLMRPKDLARLPELVAFIEARAAA